MDTYWKICDHELHFVYFNNLRNTVYNSSKLTYHKHRLTHRQCILDLRSSRIDEIGTNTSILMDITEIHLNMRCSHQLRKNTFWNLQRFRRKFSGVSICIHFIFAHKVSRDIFVAYIRKKKKKYLLKSHFEAPKFAFLKPQIWYFRGTLRVNKKISGCIPKKFRLL